MEIGLEIVDPSEAPGLAGEGEEAFGADGGPVARAVLAAVLRRISSSSPIHGPFLSAVAVTLPLPLLLLPPVVNLVPYIGFRGPLNLNVKES